MQRKILEPRHKEVKEHVLTIEKRSAKVRGEDNIGESRSGQGNLILIAQRRVLHLFVFVRSHVTDDIKI